MPPSVTLARIRASADRIRRHVRRTPLLALGPVRQPVADPETGILLKLECLQITGSFKARGAMSKLTTLATADAERGLVTASGGNHGLGVAYAAWQAGVPAHVFLPQNTPDSKVAAFAAWGAQVRRIGAVWDDANQAALTAADTEDLTYIHPFADPDVIAGQGTVGLEILADCPDVDTLLVSIGGGGLISGIATAAKALKPTVRVIGIEPVGAPTLRRSLDAGALVTLERIETAANTLAPRQSAALNLSIIQAQVDDIRLVTDADMKQAAEWLWQETGIAAELSGAAALAALQCGAYRPAPGEQLAVLICGAGRDGMTAPTDP